MLVEVVTETLVLADAWGWHHDDVGLGWWLVMMVGMALFWGTVIALVVWLLRGGVARRETPEEALRRRLADGSISVEEYEQRRAALHSGPAHGDRPG